MACRSATPSASHPRHQAERAAPHHQNHQVAAGSVACDVPDERAGAPARSRPSTSGRCGNSRTRCATCLEILGRGRQVDLATRLQADERTTIAARRFHRLAARCPPANLERMLRFRVWPSNRSASVLVVRRRPATRENRLRNHFCKQAF